MALQEKALGTVSSQLWAGINTARKQLVGLLQGDGLRSTTEQHALIEEIRAYIDALDILHTVEDAGQKAVADALGVSVSEVVATSGAGQPGASGPADDISSISRGI